MTWHFRHLSNLMYWWTDEFSDIIRSLTQQLNPKKLCFSGQQPTNLICVKGNLGATNRASKGDKSYKHSSHVFYSIWFGKQSGCTFLQVTCEQVSISEKSNPFDKANFKTFKRKRFLLLVWLLTLLTTVDTFFSVVHRV